MKTSHLILLLVAVIAIIAAAVFGIMALTNDDGDNAGSIGKNAPAVQATAEPDTYSNDRAPFLLTIETVDLGNVDYLSFSVYFNGKDGQELYYECGRKYKSSEVRTIRWQDTESYNIVVTFLDGSTELYNFDGSNGWFS